MSSEAVRNALIDISVVKIYYVIQNIYIPQEVE